MSPPRPLAAVPHPWRTLDEAITAQVNSHPDDCAYIEPDRRLSWRAYDAWITLLADHLLSTGLSPGERVGVWLEDGAEVHIALSACLRAGLVATGIGARSGRRELEHLLGRSGASALLTSRTMRAGDTPSLFHELEGRLPGLRNLLLVQDVLPVPRGEVAGADPSVDLAGAEARVAGHRAPTDRLCLINSTSGTTGLPKCVAHDERRWLKYHEYAADAGRFEDDDVCMSVIPAPFGFGLWTSHFSPTLLGVPTVLIPRFDVSRTLQMIERERVTVLMAVCTQFVMMIGHPDFDEYDLSSLRVLFTGGEALPYHKAAEFEERTGCTILNMYGSNETGVQSYTTMDDPRDLRLTTGGRLIPEAEVRLFDDDGAEVARPGPGRPGSIGMVSCLGYYDDEAANRELYTDEGWMLMGDLVEIGEDGYLRVVGRTSDFIIRGGKNISAPAVEEEVSTHPGVLRSAAVAMPDEVFGEKVCLYVVPKRGVRLTLSDIVAHLDDRGVSKEWFPERLVVVDALPVSTGGKLAKAQLREDLARRLREEDVARAEGGAR